MQQRQYLQMQVMSIASQKSAIEWITEFQTEAEKVANFGCDIGGETLALMWLLDAGEGVGLDIDEKDIRQARDRFENLQQHVRQAERAVQYYTWVSEEDRAWWLSVPEFFRQKLAQEGFHLDYLAKDITQPTDLPDDYYDLAFCDFVLHHIWYDKGREQTQLAVREMARVVRPGGGVAAKELIQFEDKPRLDFAKLFESSGLQQIAVEEHEVGAGWVGQYFYRKRS